MRDRQQRHIRVFISSTFRDMQGEREELVKRVFPHLRKLCDERQVTWGEVDLRWGITDEAKAEGKVLSLCLEEIERCRPYFVCFLGERYGWVPDEMDKDLVGRAPWLESQVGKSVTELEILHGVLNNPAMEGHALFYFRDPAYVDRIPDDQRGAFQERPSREELLWFGEQEAHRLCAERREQLASLKARIVGSGFPVKTYSDVIAFGRLVQSDFEKVIDHEFPADAKPSSQMLVRHGHAAYARQRRGIYIGRREYFARLDDHVTGNASSLLVCGASGSGKSALLANWADAHRKAHPDTFVVEHYVGAMPGSSDWKDLVRNLLGELREKFRIESDIPWRAEDLRGALREWLRKPEVKGAVVIVIDALNQLEDREGALGITWLPDTLPRNVRLICSSLPGAPLDEITKRGWPRLAISPLTETERSELIRDYLAQYAKRLGDDLTKRLVEASQTSSPLYLRTLLEELRLHGEHESLSASVDGYLQATSCQDLFVRILERYERDYERDAPRLVKRAMSALWASRRGLSESEILEIVGFPGPPLPHAYWAPLFLAIESSLVNISGRLSFGHEFLRSAVQRRYLAGSADQAAAHRQLADYFAAQPLGHRKVEELPYQLAEAEDWDALCAQFSDIPFLKAAWEANQYEVKHAWAQVEAHSAHTMVGAYRRVLSDPAAFPDAVWPLAGLFLGTNHYAEASTLREYQIRRYREAQDWRNLQAVLMEQSTLLVRQSRHREALPILEQAERLCRNEANRSALKDVIANKGLLLLEMAEYQQATASLREAEIMARELGDSMALQSIKNGQSIILSRTGDHRGALALVREMEEIAKSLDDVDGQDVALRNQAGILKNLGEYAAALGLLRKSEQLCRSMGNLHGLAGTLGSLADIMQVQGQPDQALTLAREAQEICERIGDRNGVALALYNQACTFHTMGRGREAIGFLEGAIGTLRDSEDRSALASSLSLAGAIWTDLGKFQQAMPVLLEAESIARERGLKEVLQTAVGNRAMIFRARGDVETAIPLYEQKLAICRETGNQKSLGIALGNLANCYYERGEFDRALEMHREKERLCIATGNQKSLANAIGNQAGCMIMQHRFDEALALLRRQEKIAREIGSVQDLCQSLQNQTAILGERDPSEALRLGREALALYDATGLSPQKRDMLAAMLDELAGGPG